MAWTYEYEDDGRGGTRQTNRTYAIGPADTRYVQENPWLLTDGKYRKYDKVTTYGSDDNQRTVTLKKGTKVKKKQRKAYAKKAKWWEKRYGGRDKKIHDQYVSRLNQIKNKGMMMNNIPVDIVDGKARYNMDAVASGLKLDPNERAMLELYNKGQQGSGLDYKGWKKLQSKVKGASTKNKGKYAMYNNFANLDPVWAKVDLNKDADMYHMSKMDFAKNRGSFYNMNIDDDIGSSIKGGWVDKYAIPAFKAVWLGAATFINPFVGAAAATAMSAVEANEAGNFSWSDVAKNAALNAGSAYIGMSGAGPIAQSAMRTGLHAGADIVEGDFDLKDTLTEGALAVGGAAAMDLGMSAAKGGLEGYKAGDTLGGIQSGLAESELGGYATSLGLLGPDSGAINQSLTEAFGDVDSAEMSLNINQDLDEAFAQVDTAELALQEGMTPQEFEKFYGTGEMYMPGGSMEIENVQSTGARNVMQDTNPYTSGRLPFTQAGRANLVGGNARIMSDQANIEADDAGIGWEDALPFLAGLTPTIANLLSGSQRRRGTGGGAEEEVDYEDGMSGFADLYNQGAGSVDPYSTQQMFGAGIQ